MDKYQEEPPSNSQWTDGDYHPDIDGVCEGWDSRVDKNVVPLTELEKAGFQGLLEALKDVVKSPSSQNRNRYAHFRQVMQAHHERWTGFEM